MLATSVCKQSGLLLVASASAQVGTQVALVLPEGGGDGGMAIGIVTY